MMERRKDGKRELREEKLNVKQGINTRDGEQVGKKYMKTE